MGFQDIASYRKAKGMSQKQLAEAVGCTKGTVSTWENGSRTPKWNTLQKLSEVLDVPMTELIDDQQEECKVPNRESLVVMENIAFFRKQKGLSQNQLAQAMGCSNGSVSNWETGLAVPTWSMLLKLCEVLDVTMGELVSDYACKDATRYEPRKEKFDISQTARIIEILDRIPENQMKSLLFRAITDLAEAKGMLAYEMFIAYCRAGATTETEVSSF